MSDTIVLTFLYALMLMVGLAAVMGVAALLVAGWGLCAKALHRWKENRMPRRIRELNG